ncbi:MAG TPA: hypothetical protein VHL80_16430, partial [Polyangia bacterium]|nr:hypothetical protein [Polyangia bacterium]
ATARAETAAGPAATAIAGAPPAPAAPPATPPPPYSLPWQLRPAAAASVIRSDTAVATYENAAGQQGSTVATMLLGSYKVTPNLAPLVRLGFVQNSAPGTDPSGTAFLNPIVGLTYGRKLGGVRLAGFLGGTVPVGGGGGDTPDKGAAGANKAGIAARSGMDNAMFAVDYFTAIGGLDAAYVDHRFTLQAEVTLLQLFRARGAGTAPATDSTRTNSTSGVHAGFFFIPQLSVGAELRYQRWLTTPTQIVMGKTVAIPDANLDTTTVAIGPRGHFALGRGMFFRPGISYARGLDKPLTASSYNVVQIDLPVSF